MTNEDCIRKGVGLLERAAVEKNAGMAFRASYYFFWGEGFGSGKMALKTAYELKKDDYLPLDYGSVSGLMDARVRAAVYRSLHEEGMEEVLEKSHGREKAGKLESALRQGGLGDGVRRLALEYIDFDVAIFLRAYLLSARA